MGYAVEEHCPTVPFPPATPWTVVGRVRVDAPAAVVDRRPMVTVYTDGSCLGNPGPGGWAWAVPDGPYASGADRRTTNQRMEVTAVLRALEAHRQGLMGGEAGGVLVRSDSTYVVNCFRQRWWAGWQRRGWRNSQGKPVANRDLWEPLLALALDPAVPARFEWVKGHSGDRWNDMVDELAVAAATTGSGSAGPPFEPAVWPDPSGGS